MCSTIQRYQWVELKKIGGWDLPKEAQTYGVIYGCGGVLPAYCCDFNVLDMYKHLYGGIGSDTAPKNA